MIRNVFCGSRIRIFLHPGSMGQKITGSLIQIRTTVVTYINTVKNIFSTNRRLKVVYSLNFFIFITWVALLKSLCLFYSWRIFPPFDTVGGRDSKSEAVKTWPDNQLWYIFKKTLNRLSTVHNTKEKKSLSCGYIILFWIIPIFSISHLTVSPLRRNTEGDLKTN